MLEIIQAHLPEEPNSFIGRERELDELRRLLDSTRALTLCGPGGIGKTRLALRLLAVVAAEFPDGARFIELADLQQPDLVIGVARGLEAFAALAVREKQPERAVQLAAAAAAVRESAGVPPLPPARTETYLAPARHLGEAAVARLWAQGLALSSEAAVTLAVDVRPSKAADGDVRALTVAAEPEATLPSRSAAYWLPSGCCPGRWMTGSFLHRPALSLSRPRESSPWPIPRCRTSRRPLWSCLVVAGRVSGLVIRHGQRARRIAGLARGGRPGASQRLPQGPTQR